MPASAMLVCDLDGTLLGNAAATTRFVQWWQTAQPSFRLVYASGRMYRSITQTIREWNLPVPDAIVSAVGTEIYFLPDGQFCAEWPNRWWSSWEVHRVSRLLDGRSELKLQPFEFQSSFKRSYYIENASVRCLSLLRQLLLEQRIKAEVTYSSNRDLDVLPAGVSKGTAADFLARRWNIMRSRVIVAGDSGNDLSLFGLGFHGIIVSNAHPELAICQGPSNYHSSRSFADGVIDGIAYWQQQLSS